MGPPERLRDALRRGWRRVAGSPSRAELFYSQRYRLELTGTAVDPLRGERVLASLISQGLFGESRVRRPEAASFQQLRRVHTDDYLDSLARPGALRDRASDNVPTGALALLELDAGHWPHVSAGSATLKRFVVPRELA